ncbi:hypothetical protein H5410_041342 [Solanum commersonii]|uniref:Uncharacterized protein n=1 Tax=Solanum commersonii TaxID=4109 RepID=A0A9J5XU90_SOLCO|nr:hypothetical protein H5410_041342 [Solanum commersonii]
MFALQAESRAIQLGAISVIKKKMEDVSALTYQQRGPSHLYPNYPQIITHTSYVPYLTYTIQPHYNPPRAPVHQNPQRPYVPWECYKQLKENLLIQSLVTLIETSDALTTQKSKDMTQKIVMV